MIVLLQRVAKASCTSEGMPCGSITRGLVLLTCVQREDTEADAKKLADKVLSYRVFSDQNDKMNLSVKDIGGEILVVPQFTLGADTNSGTRPSFSPVASPALGTQLFDSFVNELKKSHLKVETGVFGTYMQVSLVNDGPVTFWLQQPKSSKE